MKRIAQALCLLVSIPFSAVLTTSCARVDTPQVAPFRVLRIADIYEPQSLSPLVAFTQSDIAYDQLFCQTLVRAGGPNRVIAQLVTRVPSRQNGDISANGTEITYHLRRDVRFADGVLFTSRDVVFTYRALLDPRNHTASLEPYRRIVSLRSVDPFTIRVRLRNPWNAAVGSLFAAADFAYGILPAHAFKDTVVSRSPWESAAFGTGAFRVVEWRRGDRIVLERNRYFRPLPRLDRIILQIIPNYETARIALVSGTVDIAPVLPVAVRSFAHLPAFRVVINYLNGYTALTMQMQRAPTNDARVRHAIAEAVDVRALEKTTFGIGRPVRSFLAPPIVTWKRPATRAPYAYDPVAAGRELDAAGWRLADGARWKDGHKLTLAYAVNADDQSDVRRAIAIQAQLSSVKVSVDLKSYAGAIFTAPDGPVRGGRFNIVGASGIAGDDPEQSVVNLCAQAHGGVNYGRYCRAAFDGLFADQATTNSDAQRDRDFDAMERLVADDVAMVPLFQYTFIVAIADRVKHYATDYLEFPVAPETWDVQR